MYNIKIVGEAFADFIAAKKYPEKFLNLFVDGEYKPAQVLNTVETTLFFEKSTPDSKRYDNTAAPF